MIDMNKYMKDTNVEPQTKIRKKIQFFYYKI
jgi:hypothetical protein